MDIVQNRLRQLVDKHVYVNQTILVNNLLMNGTIEYKDVSNKYEDLKDDEVVEATKELMKEDKELSYEGAKSQAIENLKDKQAPREIYEWWIVSEWLESKLKENGQPILKTDCGSWWGRCGTGQAVFLDSVIEKIYKDSCYWLNYFTREYY